MPLWLWPARVLESFEKHSVSRANQVETNESVGSENTCRWCPPVLGYRTMRYTFAARRGEIPVQDALSLR